MHWHAIGTFEQATKDDQAIQALAIQSYVQFGCVMVCVTLQMYSNDYSRERRL